MHDHDSLEHGRLRTAVAAKAFILAGSATVTFVSKKTETRFTYKIGVPDDENDKRHFVGLLNGPDNESNYTFLGTIFGGEKFRHGKKSKVGADAPSARAFDWVWNKLTAGQLPADVEVWHEGRCGRCNHKLTVPESISTGFGPECVKHIGHSYVKSQSARRFPRRY
jgi:hypothetical protein